MHSARRSFASSLGLTSEESKGSGSGVSPDSSGSDFRRKGAEAAHYFWRLSSRGTVHCLGAGLVCRKRKD